MTKKMKLSNREIEVAEMLLDGLKNREMAMHMDINQKTVSTFVQRIRIKLGISKDSNSYAIVTKYLEYKEQKEMDDKVLEYMAAKD
jgi:DNA-binding NarL/FixJ family response regulator